MHGNYFHQQTGILTTIERHTVSCISYTCQQNKGRGATGLWIH